MTAVDARFAGGTIFVDQGTILDGEPIVVVDLPGHNGIPLRPFEARALADALRGIAHEIDKKPLRRRADVDEALRDLDDV